MRTESVRGMKRHKTKSPRTTCVCERPEVQEVYPAGREVPQLVRQRARVGGFHLVLKAAAQGVSTFSTAYRTN